LSPANIVYRPGLHHKAWFINKICCDRMRAGDWLTRTIAATDRPTKST